jgi:hypothetical protein
MLRPFNIIAFELKVEESYTLWGGGGGKLLWRAKLRCLDKENFHSGYRISFQECLQLFSSEDRGDLLQSLKDLNICYVFICWQVSALSPLEH